MYVSVVEFAEALGVEFSMDWDGEVTASWPETLDKCDLIAFLNRHAERFEREFKSREEARRCVFVGGPLNGEQNRSWRLRGTVFCRRIRRARWAVYRQGEDGRAFFLGFATSERTVKRLELSTRDDGDRVR